MTNIENDLSNFKFNENTANYSIQNFFIYNIEIENNYSLNKDNPKFIIFAHDEYVKILEKDKDRFGKDKSQMEPEYLHNPIQEGVFLSSKSYSYICKNDINHNKHKMKNNMLHTKGVMNSYSQQYIDHNLFKQTLLNNDKPQKVSFNTISVKNQQISTNKITKNNIEFLNDKRYIKDVNSNVPHTLYVE